MQVLLMTATTVMRRPKPSDDPRWQKQWRVERARGFKRRTDISRARVHIQSLMASHGVSCRSIAEAAGVSPSTINLIERGEVNLVGVKFEKAIRAVRVEDIFERPNPRGAVPIIGARRRIQALMAIGWRHQDLTPLLGFRSANIVHQGGHWVSRKNHEAVKDLYDRLWNQRGPATAQSMSRIAKAGYAPPLAWDDDSIDDPNASPDLGDEVHKHGPAAEDAVRFSETLVENVEFLLRTGIGWAGIPGRLGMEPAAVERSLYRSGRRDLVSRAKNLEDTRDYVRAS
ncbi:helix-turn-helix DNA binding protein [Arthrobacter phage Maja]|uniref:Helix-turn-helix DNA binding protein n=1 Tax=Arthrobacter phage Maja TaxID=2499009 RepID=A0A3S9UN15_9CAUD|nr:helix-turn-helix DNA binding protein [Arthrobacter phage Maja]AZS11740.1 helix-turn-helix DNA-binding protein [Arthrobacter phage Maja]